MGRLSFLTPILRVVYPHPRRQILWREGETDTHQPFSRGTKQIHLTSLEGFVGTGSCVLGAGEVDSTMVTPAGPLLIERGTFLSPSP